MGLAISTRRRVAAALLASAAVAASGLAATQALAGPAVLAQAADTVEATAANQFSPPRLEVKVGTTVTWTNPASGFHTVTGGTPAAKDTSKINAPLSFKTYEVTFDKAGTFPYFCEPHAPGMAGEIVVTAAGPAGGSATASPAAGGTSPTTGASEPNATTGSQTPRPVEGGEGKDGHVPGIDDNEVITRIHDEEASNDKQIKGFQTLLWGMVAAMLALAVALFLSTRPRRANR